MYNKFLKIFKDFRYYFLRFLGIATIAKQLEAHLNKNENNLSRKVDELEIQVRESIELNTKLIRENEKIYKLLYDTRSKLIRNFSVLELRDLAKELNIDITARFESKDINNMEFVDKVFNIEVFNNLDFISDIFEGGSNKLNTTQNRARGLPFASDTITSDHYKVMLKRYLFAGKIFCTNKRVLDSCCGAGWGSYILSNYARELVAYDYNRADIERCKDNWNKENIEWLNGDALNLHTLGFEDQSFDVITAMETIEHFTREDGEKYIADHAKLIKTGGVFIATSLFPKTKHEAENSPVLTDNKYHLYLWTIDEIVHELNKYYSEVKTNGSWMVIAKK